MNCIECGRSALPQDIVQDKPRGNLMETNMKLTFLAQEGEGHGHVILRRTGLKVLKRNPKMTITAHSANMKTMYPR